MPMEQPKELEAFVEGGRGEEKKNSTSKRESKKDEKELDKRITFLLEKESNEEFRKQLKTNGETITSFFRRVVAMYINKGYL